LLGSIFAQAGVDLKDLNYFVSVAEAYGFRRAAEHIGI
jgi:DNA-binding transcriptional LysR family regulator